MIRRALREVITRWRSELHISQFKMAELCGTSRTHISRLENCKESTTLTKIQEILTGVGKNWRDFGEAMEIAMEEIMDHERGHLLAADEKSKWHLK